MRIRSVVSLLTLLAGLLLGGPFARASISASQAFQSLTSSYSGAGSYSTGTRRIMVAGSLHVWVPTSSVQLISLQPPSLNAGCGGISLYFGGFSFINGAQFQQLVTDVMQNAEGYVMELAIRSLCPMCADILDSMQKLAQIANQLGANSCAIATNLVNAAAKTAGIHGLRNSSQVTATQHVCAKSAANSGQTSDYDQALSGLCSTAQSAVTTLNSWLNSLQPSQQASSEADNAAIYGNTEWALLTEQGYADTDIKDLILSMTGFSVKNANGSALTGFYPRTLSPHAYIEALLYGTQPGTTAGLLAASKYAGTAYSSLIFDYKQKQQAHYLQDHVYLCGTLQGSTDWVAAPAWTPYETSAGGPSYLEACNGPFEQSSQTPTIASLANNAQFGLLGQNGLLYDVAVDFGQAVHDVQTNRPIAGPALALMQLTPLPVYQMVDLAAVYPGVASRLVHTYSTLIALEIARAVTVRGLSDASAYVYGASGSPGPGAFQAIQKITDQLQKQTKADTSVMNREIYLEEGMFLNIQQIQRVVAQQATQNGLAGGLLFTRGLAASVAAGH